MFERATLSLGTIRVTSKVALWAGSSQQGRARLASAAWRERERERERAINFICKNLLVYIHLKLSGRCILLLPIRVGVL